MFAEKVIRCEWAQARWFSRALLVALVAHSLAFEVARAQNGCPALGPHEDALKDHVADAIRSHDFSSVRSDSGVPVLDSGVTTVITDAAVCNAIYAGVFNNITSMWKLPGGADRAAALASQFVHYYRIGDYYAAMLITKPDVLVVNGWADVMIFSRSTLQFIGVVRA